MANLGTRSDRKIGRFRNDDAQARFDAAYASALASWPVTPIALDVPTRFGTTRVNSCGSSSGSPIVLLHGMMMTSTSWAPNVVDLGRHHPLYAVDTICDAGQSVQERRIHGGEDLAAWLDEVVDGLGLDRTHLVGLSYGSWISINQAMRSPSRVISATAIEPPGVITRGKVKLILQFVRAGVRRTGPAFERLTRVLSNGHLPPPPIYEVLRSGFLDFKVVQPFAELLDDDELRSITRPILLLFGGRSPMSDGDRAIKRARGLIPEVEAEIVPGTAHTPPLEAPELTDRRILQFIDHVDAADGSSERRSPPDPGSS